MHCWTGPRNSHWIWLPLSVPCQKLGHQRACKTIEYHFLTRSYSWKACKHTAVPLVTSGPASPLSNSALSPSVPCTHDGERNWVPVFALLLIWPGDYFNLGRGAGGDTLMQGNWILCALSSQPLTTPWGTHMVCGPVQSIPLPPLTKTWT